MSQDLNSIPYILFELDAGINALQRLKASFEHALSSVCEMFICSQR